jgi:hypothetical protein
MWILLLCGCAHQPKVPDGPPEPVPEGAKTYNIPRPKNALLHCCTPSKNVIKTNGDRVLPPTPKEWIEIRGKRKL